MTDIRISSDNSDRTKRIAAGISELMADEGYHFQGAGAEKNGSEYFITLTFKPPTKD